MTEKDLDRILDSLTLREIMLVIRLHDLIMRRLRVHLLRYLGTARSTGRVEDLISSVIYEYLRRGQAPEAGVQVEEEVPSERVAEFVDKLRRVLREEQEKREEKKD